MNDGLVTNVSLFVGVAAADPRRHVVILAGIAGHPRVRCVDVSVQWQSQ
jgi:VIT1/CCC1 family predicted Fe2+/Mn2+ transporter